MAKSQSQWNETLRTWVPSWFFEKDVYSAGLFMAMSKILADMSDSVEDTVKQTFIDQAVGSYLDLLGDERNVARLPGEMNAQYAVRIKSRGLVSNISKPRLTEIVNQLLIAGTCQIKEDWEGGVYFDRESFYNRAEVLLDEFLENTFTLVVDRQVHEPYSFFDREHFADREDYVGTSESSDYVFNLILNAVNDNKAFGVLYRIYERLQ